MTRRAEGGVRVREGGKFPEDAVRGRVDPHLAFEPSRVDFVVVFLVTPTTESGRGIVPDSRVFDIVSVCVEAEYLNYWNQLKKEGLRHLWSNSNTVGFHCSRTFQREFVKN